MIATEDAEVKLFFELFVKTLFQPNAPDRFGACSLHNLLEVVAASVIMHHDEMTHDCSPRDPIVKKVNETMRLLNFPVPKFRKLGKDIYISQFISALDAICFMNSTGSYICSRT